MATFDQEKLSSKQVCGLDLLRSTFDFDSVHGVLCTILTNICESPHEPKYRRLRLSNKKIGQLLGNRGARLFLVGCGFVEEEGALTLPVGPDADRVAAAGLDGLRARMADRAAAENQVKAEAVRARREAAAKTRRAEDAKRKGKAEAVASHLLLKDRGEASLARLAAWKAEIEGRQEAPAAAAAFAAIAREHSQCPSSARGGHLGSFIPGKMVAEFDAVVFAEAPGAVYGPVVTTSGAHLIFLHSRREADAPNPTAT